MKIMCSNDACDTVSVDLKSKEFYIIKNLEQNRYINISIFFIIYSKFIKFIVQKYSWYVNKVIYLLLHKQLHSARVTDIVQYSQLSRIGDHIWDSTLGLCECARDCVPRRNHVLRYSDIDSVLRIQNDVRRREICSPWSARISVICV